MKSLKEKIEVMRAADEGADIEAQWLQEGETLWKDEELRSFNWVCFDYRIKPIPMEFWINVYSGSLCKVHYDTKEEAEDFGKQLSSYVKTIKAIQVEDE